MPGRRRLGLALGAGAARGWAHLGVVQALAERDIEPDVVAGCSSGAFIGAFVAARRLDRLEAIAGDMSWLQTFRMLDWRIVDGGLIKGGPVVDLVERELGRKAIAELARPFACTATELPTGRERWLMEGDLGPSILASMAVPGIVAPQRLGGRELVDGALINPVPVSLAKALGADVVIAVALGGELSLNLAPEDGASTGPDVVADHLVQALGIQPRTSEGGHSLGYFEVVSQAMIVMQNFVTRIRLASEPADLLLIPDVAAVGLHEFHRADDAVAAGRRAVEAAAEAIDRLTRG